MAFLVALSNAWGVFIVILLLGHGLIAVPKELWESANYNLKIKFIEWQANELSLALKEKNDELTTFISKLKNPKMDLESHFSQNVVNRILFEESIMEDELQHFSKYFSKEELIDLNWNIKRTKYEILRYKIEMKELFNEWLKLKRILLTAKERNIIYRFYDEIRKTYYLNLKPFLLRISAVVVLCFSIVTVISEITIFSENNYSLFGYLIRHSDNELMINLYCVVPLMFLFLCSLKGLFSLKLSSYYGIYNNQNTDSFSLLFLTSFFCRIGFPLCQNFLLILKLDKNTALDEILGVIDMVPFVGKSFHLFYPVVLILLIIFNLFELNTKVLKLFKISTFSESEIDPQKLKEGLKVLEEIERGSGISRDSQTKVVYTNIENEDVKII